MSLRATALRILAGLAGSLVVTRLGLLPTGDRFATTLVALPILLVLAAELDRHARRLGARRVEPAVRWAERLGLVAWVLTVLGRRWLPVEGLDLVLAAAGGALLLVWAARRLLAYRPLLGKRLEGLPSWVFWALPLLVYWWLLPWSTAERPPDGDEPWYLLMTHSLAFDLDAELTNNYRQGDWRGFLDRPLEPQPGDPVGPHGELYSRHNAFLPLLLAPAYRLGGLLGALATMAVLTAALAWATLALARRYFPERPGAVLLAYGLTALAPPLVLYSHQIWVEVPAALLGLVALELIYRLAEAPASVGGSFWQSRRNRLWLALLVTLVALPLLKIRFMLLGLPLAALAWWRAGRQWRSGLVLAAALGTLGGGILLHNQWRYGNALKIHTWQEVELHHYSLRQYFLGSSGLFWDAAFGLFFCAPLWFLLVPATLRLLRERHRVLADLALFAGPYLAIVVPRSEWYGGWSPPFRYALVALPLLGLLLAAILPERRGAGARALVAGLGLLTLALTVLWLAVPGWTYNFADGRTYLLDHLSRFTGTDMARLFPSSVRPRAATWVWPLVTGLLVPLLWHWPRRRSSFAGRAGALMALVLVGSLPWLGLHLPTTRLDLEDPQVTKSGGHPYPDAWVIERTRFQGGWVLREGEELSAPLVPGGEHVALAIEAQLVRHHEGEVSVELWAGETKLGTIRPSEDRTWHRHELSVVDWPGGTALRMVFPGQAGTYPPNGVLLDRVELQWR
jgi:hypothetical protein